MGGKHATSSALDKPQEDASQAASGGHKVFLFSANDEDGISRVLATLAEHLQKQTDTAGTVLDDTYLSNLAFTLSERRSRLAWQLAVTADSATSLLAALTDPAAKSGAVRPGKAVKLAAAFIFTGQGAQWFAMGRELLAYDVFRARVAEADRYLASLGSGFSVLEELTQREPDTTRVDQPLYSQTLCTVLQVALVDLLASWNLMPKRVVGHSSGEIGAAYAAGALDREAAWRVAYCRGVVSAKPSASGMKGAMMAVGCSAEEVLPLIAQVNEKLGAEGELVIACYNSPKSLTISGDEAKIDALGDIASSKKLFARKLRVAKAYHSRHMVPVSDEYRAAMGVLSRNPQSMAQSPHAEVFSSVTGGLLDASEMSKPEYWTQNLVSPVRFSEALVALCTTNVAKKQLKVGGGADLPVTHLVEVGPHGALQAAARDAVLSDPNFKALQYSSVLTRGKHACATALHTIGALAAAGFPVDLPKVNSQPESARLLVDLPPYPFHHAKETELWVEARRSRAWRFRKHARHDLLGAAVRDWDPEAPRWRNHLRVSELPWLKDHRVTGNIVVAGVTYLAMAMEAVRQLTVAKGEAPLAFDLRDVSISRALQVQEDEDTETMFSMKRVAETRQSDSSMWWEWKVTSFSPHDETWLEHCRGQIAAETESSPRIATGVIDSGREAAAREARYSELLSTVVKTCTQNLTKDLSPKYAELERIGLEFGPLFRNITSVMSTSAEVVANDKRGQALATVKIPDLAQSMPAYALADNVIQAPVFDSILHSFIFALQAAASSGSGSKRLTEPMVPVAIREVWVSADIESRPDAELVVHADSGFVGHKRVEANITAWSSSTDDGATRPVGVVLRGLEAVPLQENSADANAASETREICYNVSWKPDIDILEEAGEVESCLREALKPLETPDLVKRDAKQLKDVQLACTLWIVEAVKELQRQPLADEAALPEHHKKYLGWLRLQVELFEQGKLFQQDASWKALMSNPAARDRFLSEYEASGHAEAVVVCRIGRDIAPILRGEVDGLHLLFGKDDILERFYRTAVGTQKIHRLMKAYADALGHKRGADLKVLEIGAGTGGTTTSILEGISPTGSRINGDSRLLKYTYTDISPGFFEQAAQKFSKWKAGGMIEFRVLDIEKDIEEQGFDDASYDLIIAANCLHATKDIKHTMTNVHRLLKPNGKLLLQETTELGCLESPIAFGMLSGWWAATEDFRPWGPLLDSDGWRDVLRDVGFAETVLALDDEVAPHDARRVQSMIVATRPQDDEVDKPLDEDETIDRILLVARTPQDVVLAEALAAAVGAAATAKQQVSVVRFADLAQHKLKNCCCIATMEAQEPFLASSLTTAEFKLLQQLVNTAGGLLWLTLDPHENPHMALASGLLRTVRWERDLDGSDLVVLHLPSGQDAQALAAHVTKVYHHHFQANRGFMSPDRHAEYLVTADGFLRTGRIVAAPPVNEFIAERTTVLQPQLQEFGADPERSLMLHTSAPGRLDKLHFIDWPGAQQPLGPDEVEIEVKAAGLNFRDIMVAMGEVVNNILGYEGAGVVCRVGADVKDFQAGDRVVFPWSGSNNCLQTRTRIPRDFTAKVPDSMSLEEAASIPIVFVTAYFCLIEVARIKAGETILVHAAAGGTGQAIIQLAKHLGAEVYATVSTREKRKLLMEEYGIPEDHIFSSRDLSFAAGIMRMTDGKGVNVIVNSLAGEALRASFNCLAYFGRFVEIGKRDIMSNGKIDMFPFSRCATFTAVDLVALANLERETTSRMIKAVMDLHAEGKLHVCRPLNLHTLTEMEDAFRMLQQGKHMGKIVLTLSPRDTVKVTPKPPLPTRLRADATYLLPGGLGGLGRSIARWLARPEQGAKNLLFLSRSGGEAETTRELLAELSAMGVTRARALKCDTSDEAQLVAALKQAEDEGFPRIAGVIQGAMQLRDSAFEFMDHEQWEGCLAPKVQGTWNLHRHLPADMEFFVMLSSVAGLVGNRGQSNYAAGNTFQDALAAHRRARGLAASCLDLCNIMSVGFVAENQETLNKNPLFFFSHDGIREDEFLSFIEFHLDAERAARRGAPQVAVGLAPLSVFRQRGLPEPTFIKTPLFRTLRSTGSDGLADKDGASGDGEGGVSVTNALKFAESLDAAAVLVSDALVRRLSRTMRIPVADIDVGKPIHVYGVDSLVAMEVRNYLASECGCEISVLDIMGNKPIELLSRDIAKGSKFVKFNKEG